MREQMVALKLELAGLRSEREKALEVAAEHARGTAKGRPYEEAVAEAVDAIARGQGDDCDAVGDFRGGGGRKGDVVVDIDGCAGAPRGRIVFEAKNSRRSRKEALAELEAAMAQRAADYGVWVVPVRGRRCRRAPRRCARSAATSCSWSTTRRTARAWRSRSRTRWRAPGC